MPAFLETVRKDTGERRFYVGGCRVTAGTFHSLGHGFCCFLTEDRGTAWFHRKEGRL